MTPRKPSLLAQALADPTRHFYVRWDDGKFRLRANPVARDPLALPEAFFRAESV